MKPNLKTLSFVIPLISSATTLFLHGYLGHFARYMADDFCTVFYAHRLGVFRSTWFWYLNWSGRFSASILDATLGALGPKVLPIIVPLTIILWLAALTLLFLALLNFPKYKFLISLTLATTGLFTLFLITPDIRQALYWGQGMRSVVPPLIMSTIQILVWNQIRSRNWTRGQLWFWGILSFLLALFTGGFSETYSAFQVAALILSLLAILVSQRARLSTTSLFVTSSLLGGICALVIVVLAPGNAERQAFFPPPPSLAGILMISLKSYLSYLLMLIDSPNKIFAILGLLSLAALVGSQLNQEMDARLLVVAPVLMFGLMFICFPPAAYGTSEPPPGRTLILPTYFFLMGILAWGMVAGNFFGKTERVITSTLLPGMVIVMFVLSASLNAISLYQSRHEFINYASRWDEIDATIRKLKQSGETQVLIPVIPNWAALNTPTDNPRFWVNICMSRYYDVQVLATTNPPPSNP